MKEVTVPTPVTQADIPGYPGFMFQVLLTLRELGGSAHVRELDDRVIAGMQLSEAQQAVLIPSGRQSVAVNRVRWACSYLRMAGALVNPKRGVWSLTDLGWNATEADIPELDARSRNIARESMLAKKAAGAAASLPVVPSVDLGVAEAQGPNVTALVESAEQLDAVQLDDSTPLAEPYLASTDPNVWHGYLLNVLKEMPPAAFERLCQQMLRESGFVKVQVIGKSGDGGIDGIGVLQMALLSFQVFFQCKRYQGSVGASAIRDFRGAMVGRTDKGLFITTGTFTSAARLEATRDGAPVLDLIDGEALCEQLKQCNLGVTTRMVEEVTVDPEWFARL